MKKFSWELAAICLAIFCVIQSLSWKDDVRKLDSLNEQVVELQKTVDEYEVAMDEKDEQIADTERELQYCSNELDRLQARHRETVAELSELKQAKTVPVYHCTHSDNSIFGKIYAMLYCFPGVGSDERCEHGYLENEIQVEMVNTWIYGLEELVGYSNPEYEEYLWQTLSDKELEKYYEQQDSGGKNLINAMIENFNAGQSTYEAMMNAFRDTDYGAISIVSPD